jgi:predicted DNA-binding protein YlxM (UPF0122 family)
MDMTKPVKRQHRKTGALSNKDKANIREFLATGWSVADIAKTLGRRTAPIEKFIEKEGLTHSEMALKEQDVVEIKAKLRTKQLYEQVKKQLSEEELVVFENTWADVVLQLNQDILATEENSLKDFVILDIKINRNQEDEKRHREEIERYQQKLEEAHKNGEIDDIAGLESQLSMLRSSGGSYNSEYTRFVDKKRDILKDLKAARDQRIQKVGDSLSSFANYLKMLQDDKQRKLTGDEIEIRRLAKEKAKERLSAWHTYDDGTLDQPFLTPDTVKDE